MSKKRKALKLLRFKAFLGAPSGIRTPDTLLKRQISPPIYAALRSF